MSKLTIEFELSEDAAILIDGSISVDLGSGVHMIAKAPRGLERINSCVLQVVLDVERTIAQSEQTPIERVHKTSPDGGLEIGQDGGSSKPGPGRL
jgi:hypothetical protein